MKRAEDFFPLSFLVVTVLKPQNTELLSRKKKKKEKSVKLDSGCHPKKWIVGMPIQ